MKEIGIMGLELENFKCHEHLKLGLNGQNRTIRGDNATGKTTVYDALTWLLFGKDSHGNGEKNIEIKPLAADGSVKDHKAITAVDALFCVDGEYINLRRELYEVWKTVRGASEETYAGNESRYFVDGVPVKKQAFTAAVDELVPESVFRLLTSVSYFASDMKWQDRRNVLFDMAGTLTDQEIMMQDSRFAPLSEGMGKLDLSQYKAKLTAEKKNYTGIKDNTPARISELKGILEDINSIDFDGARQQEAQLHQQIDGIRTQLAQIDNGTAVKQADMDAREARLMLDKLEAENQAHRAKQQTGGDAMAAQAELNTLKQRGSLLRQNIKQGETEAKRLEEDVKRLRDQWIKRNGESFTGGVCPTCHQPLPLDQLQSASAEFDAKKKEDTVAIAKSGSEAKARKAEWDQRISKWNEELELCEAGISTLEDTIAEAQASVKPVSDMPGYQATRDSITATISQLEAKAKELKAQGAETRAKLNTDFAAASAELKEIQAVLAKGTVKESAEKRIKDLQADTQRASEALERIDQMIFLIEEFTRFKASFVEKSVNDLFLLANFRLFREQANGGLEERCDVTYDGVPYAGLNTGMQINAGIDIINTLSRHYGYHVPLFVDNAEAVTNLAPADTQVIRLVVDENAKELTINED